MSKDQKTVGDRFKSNSTCKVFGSGGDRLELAKLSSMQEEAYGEWIQSVKNNPQVIELGLSGIWTLVKDPDEGRGSQSRVHSRNELFASHRNHTNYFDVRGRHGNAFDFS